jgi:hypothetical protein
VPVELQPASDAIANARTQSKRFISLLATDGSGVLRRRARRARHQPDIPADIPADITPTSRRARIDQHPSFEHSPHGTSSPGQQLGAFEGQSAPVTHT